MFMAVEDGFSHVTLREEKKYMFLCRAIWGFGAVNLNWLPLDVSYFYVCR